MNTNDFAQTAPDFVPILRQLIILMHDICYHELFFQLSYTGEKLHISMDLIQELALVYFRIDDRLFAQQPNPPRTTPLVTQLEQAKTSARRLQFLVDDAIVRSPRHEPTPNNTRQFYDAFSHGLRIIVKASELALSRCKLLGVTE